MTINLFVFGATGDLFKRKIYPAIKEIKENIKIFAVGRKDLNTKEFLEKYIQEKEENLEYIKIDYIKEEDYKKIIELTEEESIFYLSTPPKIFKEILEKLKKFDVKNKKIKIAFEKPFGINRESFEELNSLAKEVFNKNQIYLVDHYLGKSGVIKIAEFRKREEYEKYWSSKYIKKIKIIAKEELGIEGRIGYYEEMGAIKDMVQNHLFQILLFTTSNISKENKKGILNKIKIKKVFLGQYEGYQKEIEKKSSTETFAKLNLEIETPEWKGTEIEIITGKKLDKKETKVVVEFFEKENLPREIIFEIFPKERICTKDENYSCSFEEEKLKNSYVNILEGIIKENKDIFPKTEELRAAWEIVDKINFSKLFLYKEGLNGEEITKQQQ